MTRPQLRLATLLLALTVLLMAIAFGRPANPVDLAEAVANSAPGDTVNLPRGTYELAAPLELKRGMALVGAGPGATVIKAAPNWTPGLAGLPQQENPQAYLLKLIKTNNVRIADLTLTGPTLHGAIYADDASGVELSNLRIKDFQWSGVRTFRMNRLKVHDCQFIDAGGEVQWTGGALFTSYTRNSEFWNNRIQKSENLGRNFYGFKGQGGESNRFHHNDVQVNFSFEFPFENETGFEIDHNRFDGVISIPKFGGGPVLRNGVSYHIHHNWLRRSYALEWARNSAEIDHNLFDFDPAQNDGNLISSFSDEPAAGPTNFHDNLIKNPGRGIFWADGVYNRFRFYNNVVKAEGGNQTQGLFGFNPNTDFDTIVIRDNIFEITGPTPRPLMRNEASYQATVQNNTLTNVADAERFTNRATGATRGLVEPLRFTVGVDNAYQVEGWTARPVGAASS